MIFSIQQRLILWLIVVALPIAAASYITVSLVQSHLTDKVIASLENDHRLETARIESALEQYKQYAKNLANNQSIHTTLSSYLGATNNSTPLPSSSDTAVFRSESETTLTSDTKINALVSEISTLIQKMDSDVVEFKISTLNGALSAQTDAYSWIPDKPTITDEAIEKQEAIFGNAFLNPAGQARLGIVVPILTNAPNPDFEFDNTQTISGLMTMELKLGPVVDLVEAHEGMGETSESHIAQPTSEGDAQFITLLRFKRDAAFNLTIPKSKDKPINWSLESPITHVVRSPDYRKIESFLAIGTIAETGWGLVVKIDVDEAFIPVYKVTSLIRNAGITSLVLIVFSWFTLIRPLALRLRTNAFAADRLATGNYNQLIEDSSLDEIGIVSNSMDQLATDLKADKLLREQAETKLKYQATHDALTGLFNRKFLHDIAEKLVADSPDMIFSVLFMDLDGFKAINDHHGHYVGDEILIQFAAELKIVIPNDSVAARWGGDEFVVILPTAEKASAQKLAALLSDRFEKPFDTSAGKQILGCSIGLSTSNNELSVADCVKIADAKMYENKQSRKQENDQTNQAVKLVTSSIKNNRVNVWYQPIVMASSEGEYEIIGAEALLRVSDESGSHISPGDFLPHIHEHEIAIALDDKIISQAFENLASWQNNSLLGNDFYLSVNVCGATASMDTLPEFLSEKIDNFQISPENVMIELSEETQNINDKILAGLKKLGVKIAVDDVGLLNSNLERLASAEPDIAKFDRVWLTDSHPNTGDKRASRIEQRKNIVLENMFSTCTQLGMECIIEGVENSHQLNMMLAIGINRFQGYLFDRALPSEQFTKKLNNELPAIWTNSSINYQKAS